MLMRWYAVIGTVSTVIVTGVLVVLAIQEPSRMQDFTMAFEARQIENGAALFETHCSLCHGPQGKGIEGFAPAINTRELFSGERLTAVGYPGSVVDYVRSTIAAGRPNPSAGTSYPNRMPTWSQRYGGPLRDDQVESLVAYVMNWSESALAGPALPSIDGVGTDITVELPEGDPENGEDLAVSFGCVACHIQTNVGPAWLPEGGQPGIGDRAAARLAEPGYTAQATTPEQYLIESIVLTNAYVVPDYNAGVMPVNLGDRLTAQDLADLVAYLLTLK